jgi:hypothetical protein
MVTVFFSEEEIATILIEREEIVRFGKGEDHSC